jgi:hypothetical protein
MELTGKKLEEVLNAELVGKDVGYSNWKFANALLGVIRIFAKKAGLDENLFNYKDGGPSSAYLTYRDVSFGDASFQKQRGKYHYGNYDWSFKKVFVNLINEDGYSRYNGLTFEEMLNRIDEDLSAKKLRDEAKLEQAKQIFQKIKAELGTKSDYEVIDYIKYLNDHKYSLH